MENWILALIPVAGLILTLFNAATNERLLWWKARSDVLTFCRDLSDRMDELLIMASDPMAESIKRPPVPTSLLSYARDCFDDDLERCLSVWSKPRTQHPYQIAPQVKRLIVQLHVEWEKSTGYHVTPLPDKDLPRHKGIDSENAIRRFKWTANLIRTRTTLLHQEVTDAHPSNRIIAFMRIHLRQLSASEKLPAVDGSQQWKLSDLLG